MTGLIIRPKRRTIELVSLPDINDRALRSSIAQTIGCKFFEFQIEFENKDVIAVDYLGHTNYRNIPYKLRDKYILFGNALVLGTDRRFGILTSAQTSVRELRSSIEFAVERERKEIRKRVEGLPSLVKPIKFTPPF